MQEVADLMSRRVTTFVGGPRRVLAIVVVSATALAAAFFTWKVVTRERFGKVKKQVRFAPTVHVRHFDKDDDSLTIRNVAVSNPKQN